MTPFIFRSVGFNEARPNIIAVAKPKSRIIYPDGGLHRKYIHIMLKNNVIANIKCDMPGNLRRIILRQFGRSKAAIGINLLFQSQLTTSRFRYIPS